jgi:hypothetical protein
MFFSFTPYIIILTNKKNSTPNFMNLVELEPLKVISLLKKELKWQLDYTRGGTFKNNQASGIFFFICIYHEPFKSPSEL